MKGATKYSIAKTMASVRTTYRECNKLMEDIKQRRFIGTIGGEN